ncbi:unnamed protein product [Malus baccata var. baccata]
MADFNVSLEKAKFFLQSQYHDEEKWALNMNSPIRDESCVMVAGCEWPCSRLYCVIKLLRAAGLFAGSILLMRSYVYLDHVDVSNRNEFPKHKNVVLLESFRDE